MCPRKRVARTRIRSTFNNSARNVYVSPDFVLPEYDHVCFRVSPYMPL